MLAYWLILTNAGINYTRGNYADAALSMSTAVPLAGTVAGLAKIAKTAKRIVKKAVRKVRPPKRIGDLTRSEIKQIQNVVNAVWLTFRSCGLCSKRNKAWYWK